MPEGARLREIHVFANWCVDGLQLIYVNRDGDPGGLPKVGAAGGLHHVFYLEDDEYLTGISGRTGWYVDSIQFHTNKRSSHVYGGAGGEQDFAIRIPEGWEIAGLFGREGWYIDALGIIVRERPLSEEVKPPAADAVETRSMGLAAESSPASIRNPLPQDLQKVEGIGPRIATLLIEHDIYDLADLAQTPVERLREILSASGRRYNIADPATWPEQAALGAEGAWDALSALQANLKAGRRRKEKGKT
jgi:predicted flap endonuclease-1-like 5' DNA nuclease